MNRVRAGADSIFPRPFCAVVNAGKANPTHFLNRASVKATLFLKIDNLPQTATSPDIKDRLKPRITSPPKSPLSPLSKSALDAPSNPFSQSTLPPQSQESPNSDFYSTVKTANAPSDVPHVQSSSEIAPVPSTISPYQLYNDLTSTGDFGSYGANLEYAVLSSMLHNSGFPSTSPDSMTSGLTSGLPLRASTDNVFPSLHSGYGDNHTFLEAPHSLPSSYPPTTFDYQAATLPRATQLPNAHSIPFEKDTAPAMDLTQAPPIPSLESGQSDFTENTIDHAWAPTPATPSHPSQLQQIRDPLLLKTQPTKPFISPSGVMRVEDVYKKVNKPHVKNATLMLLIFNL